MLNYIYLSIEGGNDNKLYELKKDEEILVGRSKSCNIIIKDRLCSSRHCRIKTSDDEIVVEDLKSTNGTFVNKKKIQKCHLKEGDVVQVGDTNITLKCSLAYQRTNALKNLFEQTSSEEIKNILPYSIILQEKSDWETLSKINREEPDFRLGNLGLHNPANILRNQQVTNHVVEKPKVHKKADKKSIFSRRRKKEKLAVEFQIMSKEQASSVEEELSMTKIFSPVFSFLIHLLILAVGTSIILYQREVQKEAPITIKLSDISPLKENTQEKFDELERFFNKDELSSSDTQVEVQNKIVDKTSSIDPDKIDKPEIKLDDKPTKISFNQKVTGIKFKPPTLNTENLLGGGSLNKAPFIEFGKDGNWSGVLLDRLKKYRGTEANILKSIKQGEIAILKGMYDDSQVVLKELGLPYNLCNSVNEIDFSRTIVVIVDCHDKNTNDEIAKLKNFVANGGYLFTTDWALNVIIKAFPGYVSKPGYSEDGGIFPISPKKSAEKNYYLTDVFSGFKEQPQWIIESGSYLIDVDKSNVEILIESEDFAKKYKYGTIAFTFSYGTSGKKSGRVMHIISHLRQLSGSLDCKGQYGVASLIVNFIIDAKRKKESK